MTKEEQRIEALDIAARLANRDQEVVEALADTALNLYSILAPFMRETDPVWRAMQEEYIAAMKLAGRDPKI